LVPYIDGVQSVAEISRAAAVHIDFAKLAIQHLLYYGCVKMVDVFQFGNIYCTTPNFVDFVHNIDLQKQCQEFIMKQHKISTGAIVRLYSALKETTTCLEWIQEFPNVVKTIDIRRFIMFGVLHDFVARVHAYPVLQNNDESLSKFHKYLNGEYHLDSLCSRFQMSRREICELFSKTCVLIYK
jgi:hypothetical protein